MVEKLLSTKRARLLKLLFFIVIIFTLGMLVYFPNYSKLKDLRQENQKLIQEIDTLKKDIVIYEIKNKNLDENSFIYEKIARDKLGVAREDEIVVDIEE